MSKKIINLGYTNIKYLEQDKLIIIKQKNSFNHNLNYEVTQQFSFVPKLLDDNEQEVVWKYIKNSKNLEKFTNQELQKIAEIVYQIHSSNISLPKNNFRQRIQYYLKTIYDKKIHIPEIDNNYREMINLLKNMRRNFPCHNDIWPNNLIKDQNDKIWLVDWEYATMGDPYFDLAYFIESTKLNYEQERILITKYQEINLKWRFDNDVLHKYKRFANWLILCWAYSQPSGPPFDVTNIKNFLIKN